MPKITIMGHDPATKNYGYCLVTYYSKKEKFKYRIKSAGILQNTVSDLKQDVMRDLFTYLDEVYSVCGDKTSLFVIERYMTRGMFSGVSNEAVNQMIGFLYSLPSLTKTNIEIMQITSATWKNRCNKFFVLDRVKKGVKPDGLSMYREADKEKIPRHIIDAFFQTAYMAETKLGVEIIPSFSKQENRSKLIRRLHEVSGL